MAHLDGGGGRGVSPGNELAGDGRHGFGREDGAVDVSRDAQIHLPPPPALARCSLSPRCYPSGA